MLDAFGVPQAPPFQPLRRPTSERGRTGPPARLIDLGHLRPILRDGMLDAYLRWALEERDDFVVWPGPKPHVVVVRPESTLQVTAPDDTFVRNAMPTADLFGRGILRQEGAPWAEVRRLLAPAFHIANLEPAVGILQEECDRLIATWAAAGEVRPTRDLSFLMLRVLGRAVFGYTFEAEKHGGRPLHRALVTLATSSVLFHLLPEVVVRARLGREIARARSWLDALCADILVRGQDTPLMCALRGSISRGDMTRATALDNLRTLLIAGHETSATATAWGVALLAQHPDRAESLRAEAGAAASVTSMAQVDGLTQAGRWSQETMRLYPPVPISVSLAARDTQLGPIAVPKGTRVDVCSYVLHRLPWLWDEPDAFRPERFATAPQRGAYLPYLHGPHTCLGIRLAGLEVPLVVARLAGALDFELVDGPPRVNLRLSLNPAGLKLRVKRR